MPSATSIYHQPMSPQDSKRARTITDASDEVFPAPVAVPNEILARIFSFAVDNLPSKPSMRTAAKIGLICKHWRKILYSTPSLWSRLSVEFTDIDDHTGDGIQKTTSTHALALCLALSHPMPLYFRFCVKDAKNDWDLRSWIKLDAFNETYIAKAFYMLLGHSARWKQASFTSDSWVVELLFTLRHLRSPGLESLTFLVVDDAQPYSWPEDLEELESVLTPRLRHLDINLHIPYLSPYWPSLKSLTIGFEGPDECRYILSQALQLEVLTITHIGFLPTTWRDTTGNLILPRVQQLNLTQCAACNLFDGLVVPSLIELSLVAFDENQEHSAHVRAGIEECERHVPVSLAVKHVVGLLENSKVIVDKFTADWYTPCGDLLPIMALVQSTSVLSLSHLDLDTDTDFLQHCLVRCKPPLFPHLKELGLSFDITPPEVPALIASFGLIEEFVCARKAAGLRKLTLEQKNFYPESSKVAEDLSPSIYASSSLARTLCKMSQARDLEVKWTAGPDIDIMHYAAAYTVPLF